MKILICISRLDLYPFSIYGQSYIKEQRKILSNSFDYIENSIRDFIYFFY